MTNTFNSNKIKIVADDKIPFLNGVLESFVNIEYYPGKEIKREKIIDADALIVRTRTKCDAALLENTSVKLITTATIGIDHIDTKYCDENNIKWLNAPGCNSSSVKQYVTTVLLALAESCKPVTPAINSLHSIILDKSLTLLTLYIFLYISS